MAEIEKNIENQIVKAENFSKRSLAKHFFTSCAFNNCDFSEANLRNAKFSSCTFSNCNLSLVQLEGCRLHDIQFRVVRNKNS